MNHIQGFEKLGLTTRDSRVYVALLKNGLSSIRAISDVTNLNRGSVYESIKALSSVGLVSFQQKNVNRKYFAEEPSKLLSLIDQRKQELNKLESTTKQSIPRLLASSSHLPYANIKFYEDHEGVAIILRDVLETVSALPEKSYQAISSKTMRQYLYKKFPSFTKKRIELGIFVSVIALGSGGEIADSSERRWLESDETDQPSSYTLIYGDKYALIALNDTYNPYGIVIEDKGVAAMQRMLFDQIWSNLKSS